MNALHDPAAGVIRGRGVLGSLPVHWFETAATLFPGLTAPGVRRLRESGRAAPGLSDSELERVLLEGLQEPVAPGQ